MALHQAPPFVFYDTSKQGDDRFRGATVDLLQEIGKIVDAKFTFTIDEQDPEAIDKAVYAVQEGSADIAGGAIRITSNWSQEVHFSLPYYDSGFLLVVKVPEESADIYKIFMPFHTSLWSVVGVEIFVIGWALYCMEAPHNTTAGESDLEEGRILGFIDAIYWASTCLLQTLDKKVSRPLFVRVCCVCACVIVREREREGERGCVYE